MKDKKRKSLFKAITWRIIGTLSTIFIIIVYTKELELSLEIGIVDVISKLLLYYMHERRWSR